MRLRETVVKRITVIMLEVDDAYGSDTAYILPWNRDKADLATNIILAGLGRDEI